MNLDRVIGRLIEKFDDSIKIPKYEPKLITKATPQELQVLCSYIVDAQALPKPFSWVTDDVVNFIIELGFPQYEETFRKNLINGRTLLLIDASALCHMNIRAFEHILIIAKAIRELYEVEKILFNRNISLPPRYPDTHYKYYRVCTGPKYENCPRTDLWRSMKILRNKKVSRNHFEKLEDWLKHYCCHRKERFGSMPRYNMYYVKPCPFSEADFIACQCIPPCECRWEDEKDLVEPWTLSFLMKFDRHVHLFNKGKPLEKIDIPLKRQTQSMKDECPHSEIVVIFKKQNISEDNADDKGCTAAMEEKTTIDSQIATEVAVDPQTNAPAVAESKNNITHLESKKDDEVLPEGAVQEPVEAVAVDTTHSNEDHGEEVNL